MNDHMNGNPYCYDMPIKDAERFVGRTAQLDRCREIIERRACLSLVGGPGSGLTSLLWRVMSDGFRQSCATGDDMLQFLFLNCQTLPDPLDLSRHILAVLQPERKVTGYPRWQAAFGTLIRAMDVLQDERRRVVLLLDDFESIAASEGYVGFLGQFRALTTHGQMSLITATHTHLKDCCHMGVLESTFPGIFCPPPQYLGPFTAEEGREFISRISAASDIDLVPYADQILALSGGIPYLVQLACWQHHEAAVAGEPLDHGTMEALLVREARAGLDRIWAGLTAEDQEHLRRIGVGDAAPSSRSELWAKGYIDGDEICSSALARYVAGVT